jgi:hypothetical protein
MIGGRGMLWSGALGAVAALLLTAAPATAQTARVGPSVVSTAVLPNGHYSYLVNGKDSLFIGMGYNPIYRYLPTQQRAANYQRDFRALCLGGVNTITGWDTDKGYDQDKFDEITLDTASKYGIGVVMPIALPPDGDYTNPNVVGSLVQAAATKVSRFRANPGVRMWGLGNEVLVNMPAEMHDAYLAAYLSVADMIHAADPNHPVIYRDAEDSSVPEIAQALEDSGDPRPWLLYGANIYSTEMNDILNRWPSYNMGRPLFVTEFGAEGRTPAERALGYASMWSTIRAHPDYVMGGAPYAWTTAGPEPTDKKWGLVDGSSRPVDNTLNTLQTLWHREPAKANGPQCG